MVWKKEREREREKVHLRTNKTANRLDSHLLSVPIQGARPVKAALPCCAGVDGRALLDVTVVLDVRTVLNVGSVLDARATLEAPLSLLEADDDGAIPAVLSPESESFTRVEVRPVVMLTLDPNPDPDAGVPPAFPTPRPLCKYPPMPVAVAAMVMVLLPKTRIEVSVPRLMGIPPLSVTAGAPGVRVMLALAPLPSPTMMDGGLPEMWIGM
jgi:hypothetical protein